MMLITRKELRAWHTGPNIYRWFLRNFPEGGRYADVHNALIRHGYVDWATSLVEYAYSLWLEKENFALQETDATDLLADVLSHRPMTMAIQQSSAPHEFKTVSTNQYAGRQASGADYFSIMNIDNSSQISNSGDEARIGSTGSSVRIASAGVNSQIGSCGEYGWISSAGYSSQVASCGYGARVGCVGHDVRIGSSGERARIATAGNSAKVSSSGRGVKIGSAGMRARISSVGDGSKVASAGDLSHISSFGAEARVVSAGNDVRIVAMGPDALIACAGSVDYVVLGKGGCASIPYFDGKRIRFAVAYEGEGNIKAGVRYCLNHQHQFVEWGNETR
ncbi:hypothetical protein LPW36_11825 [Jinshanibacter sp. LJY008]|uniref:Oxidoreductase subunit n=1 Tax=Limnobaculum eriocheiris TaxID=2897391 RepID=A0A9X1MYR5_9GAMM|nr:hypothetical protein [Limnobaculum eriocheiris]MCD1126675.1 hypothetical protein [Limnobaculum eriocheiris]